MQWVQQFLHVVFESPIRPAGFPVSVYVGQMHAYFLKSVCWPSAYISTISLKAAVQPGHWLRAVIYNKCLYVLPASYSATLCTCFLPVYANCLHMYFLQNYLLTRCICLSFQSIWWQGSYLFPPSLNAYQVLMYIVPIILETGCIPISSQSVC
jgi:hypothetical protein